MNNPEFYRNLRFETHTRAIPHRLITVSLSLGLFILLWLLVSHDTLFWILLLLVGILTWVASYGWRQALTVIHEIIHNLEQN